jgi:chorismate-pyruvate lyase
VLDWPTQLLARRSAFMRDNTPLLVTEVFLPTLMQR